MKIDVIGSILGEQKSVRRDGNVYVCDEQLHVTVFAGASGDLLTVPRVVRVELAKEYCTFVTSKHERYYLTAELILGLKLEQGDERSKGPGGAGFSR